MQARIATLSLIALMVVALLLAARWQGPGRAPGPVQAAPMQAATPGDAQEAGPAPPITPDPDRAPTPTERDDAVWEKLQQPISVAFEATPLTDVVAFIADATGTQTYLDMRALGDEGIDPNQATVTSELTNLPAEMVLDLVLGEHGLGYTLRDGAMIVTSASVSDRQTKVRIYPVGDLVGQHGDLLVDLIEIIQDNVGSDTWAQQGGLGEIASFDKTLVVTQTDKIHRQIQLLLQQLRTAQRIAPASEPRMPLTPVEVDDAVWQKLQKRIDVSFAAAPLTDVVKHITNTTGTRAYLDLRAFEDEAINPDALTVTIELTHVPADRVLDLALGQLDLHYSLYAGTIVISAGTACWETKVRTYPVGDLVGQDFNLLVELTELIEETVAPDSWAEQGGMGGIGCFDKTLVVTQTDRIHRQIQLLLQQLRLDQRRASGMP